MRRNLPLGKAGRTLPAFTAALMAAGVLTNVHAQIQSAGDLFVDIDATSQSDGPVTSLVNRGTLGGVFASSAPANAPTVGTVGGTKTMMFDGDDFLRHMTDATPEATPITAPAELTGPAPTRSIEVWALNPALAAEETLVSWGHRGDPAGGNMSFNYGSDFRWGAVGHWGNQDLGWNNQGGGPTTNKWHHLVYTYDGTTTRVYADGQLANAEYLGPDAINTWPDTAILVGAQTEPDAVTVTGGLRFSGSIARMRIHDGVLTPEQVAANYNTERAAFIDPGVVAPVQPTRLSKTPIHRWSFNNAAGDATGATIEDVVGDADGTVLGEGATFTGTRLALPGGSSAVAAYVDLPNGLLSSHSTNNAGTGKFSIEAYVKVTGAQNWGRIWDFGSTGPAGGEGSEIEGPGGTGEGRDYFAYTASIGVDVNNRRLEVRNEDPAGGGIVTVDNPTSTYNTDTHIVVTWDEFTGRLTAYENGRQVSTVVTDDAMSEINDLNVWLGRSAWLGDANAQIEYDDVRIYDYVLTPGEVLGNAGAGPVEFNNRDFAVTFLNNPSNTTVSEGSPVTFIARVAGSSPYTLQWFRNGAAIANATNTTYTIPTTTFADNNAVFTVTASNTVNGTPASATSTGGTLTIVPPTDRLTRAPVNRWSFNEAAGEAINGESIFEDSIGDADGIVRGDGATFTGTRLTLPGGSSQTAAYGDLPNGLISRHSTNNAGTGQLSIETWVRVTGTQNWARIFDFGSSGPAGGEGVEVEGPGGAGEGRDYLMYSASTDTNPNNRRLEYRNEDPGGGGITTIDNPTATFGSDAHIVITWDEATGRLTAYENGRQVSTTVTDDAMSELNDINVWLGRSNWLADSNMQGEYDEVRIYDYVLTQRQAAGNFAAGPTVVNNVDVAPFFTLQPISRTIPEGGNATFTVEARGSTPFTIQWYRNGVLIPGATSTTLSLTNVTAADNNAVFTARVTNTVNGEQVTVTSDPATLTVPPNVLALRHRYSFSETTGTVLEDSVGNADGELVGTDATLGGGTLTLNGTDAYVNLPDGIITGLGTDGTIELWIENRDSRSWARIFDFGISNEGPDQSGGGLDFLFLTARNGDGIPEFTANFPGGDNIVTLFPAPPANLVPGQTNHIAVVWENSKNTSRIYYNGVLVATGTASRPLSDMAGQDKNNWLGRAQFNDPFWTGVYDEVRLTSGAMSAAQVADSFAAGPGNIPNNDQAPRLSIARNGNNIVISWPASATGYNLESTTSLTPPITWTAVAGATQNGDTMQITVPIEGNAKFFRLRK